MEMLSRLWTWNCIRNGGRGFAFEFRPATGVWADVVGGWQRQLGLT